MLIRSCFSNPWCKTEIVTAIIIEDKFPSNTPQHQVLNWIKKKQEWRKQGKRSFSNYPFSSKLTKKKKKKTVQLKHEPENGHGESYLQWTSIIYLIIKSSFPDLRIFKPSSVQFWDV